MTEQKHTVRSQSVSSVAQSCPRSLLKFMSIQLVMSSNYLILCHPLLLSPSIFPSIRVFSNESALRIRWPKYWSFSNSPFNEYSGLISFKMDWLDLLAVQGTLRSLLQHHSSKALILQCSAFFIVQLSHPYSSVQSLSCIQLFVTPWTAAHQASLSFTISQSLLRLRSLESVMPSASRDGKLPIQLPHSF